MTTTTTNEQRLSLFDMFPTEDEMDHGCTHIECPVCAERDRCWQDRLWSQLTLFHVRIRDTWYLTDRHLMIRADLVDSNHDELVRELEVSAEQAENFAIPEECPPTATEYISPRYLAKTHDCGITIHQPTASVACHLYRHGEHVGWAMPALRPAAARDDEPLPPTPADIPDIWAVAQDLPVVGPGHPWETAWALVQWYRTASSNGLLGPARAN